MAEKLAIGDEFTLFTDESATVEPDLLSDQFLLIFLLFVDPFLPRCYFVSVDLSFKVTIL